MRESEDGEARGVDGVSCQLVLGLASHRQSDASNGVQNRTGAATGRSVDLVIEGEGGSLFSLRHGHEFRVSRK